MATTKISTQFQSKGVLEWLVNRILKDLWRSSSDKTPLFRFKTQNCINGEPYVFEHQSRIKNKFIVTENQVYFHYGEIQCESKNYSVCQNFRHDFAYHHQWLKEWEWGKDRRGAGSRRGGGGGEWKYTWFSVSYYRCLRWHSKKFIVTVVVQNQFQG